MRDESEMSKADLDKVNSVINSGYNAKHRKPFSFWKIMLGCYAVVAVISAAALLIAWINGVL